MSRLALTLVTALALSLLTPVQALAGRDGPVSDHGSRIVLTGETYRMTIDKNAFRYGLSTPEGRTVAGAHSSSGMLLGGSEAVRADLARGSTRTVALVDVAFADGRTVRVRMEPHRRWVRVTVPELPEGGATVDFRTAGVAPAYGLGDYGSHADGQPDEDTPCGGNVEARPRTELTGAVFDNITNEGSCKRFISNFVVFPKQRLGQVLFDEGQKRAGLTGTENRLGVVGAGRVDSLYYFVGSDLQDVYRDYRDARKRHGYVDAKPRQRLFELGWEAYGALTWNTHQQPVEDTVQGFLDHGYDLRWGVVGSGFWPGPRGNGAEGSTTSFGMWDEECDYDPADGSYDLPCPRYPDPQRLRKLFSDNDMSLILGLRNNFKAPDLNENWNEHYDGPFARQALERGYFLKNDGGSLATVTRAQYPRGPQYVLDADNREALDWFVDNAGKWEAGGFKEDAMLYEPNLHRDDIWNPLDKALHDEGYDVIVRNAAYSVPGDVIRVNDTYYGFGLDYNSDPDRLPVNMLNVAASGAPNVYADYVGGTPTAGGMTDPSYQDYFVRNAWLLAASPSMAFARGPWEMDDPEVDGDQGERYAESVRDAADFHQRLVPYLYDAALDSHRSGFPSTMTPMPVAYPDDENTYHLASEEGRNYQWMLGESLLAAPVFGADFETARTRDVYLPAGSWIDYATGARFEGPRTLEDYPLGTDRAPVFAGGSGIVVERAGKGLDARVFPVGDRGENYTFSGDGKPSDIRLANAGWNTRTLRVIDRTVDHPVRYEIDPVTGAVEFPVTSGHDYVLVGGRGSADTIDRGSSAPGTPQGLRHTVADDGLATLHWDAVKGATSYAVQVEGAGQCPDGSVAYAGSTTGATSLPLGQVGDAGGSYRVVAWSSGGPSDPSAEHVIESADNSGGEVIVTDEGKPDTCDPEQPAYSEEGSWAGSSLSGFDGSKTRYSAGGTATWRAALEPGTYEVSVWFPAHSSSTTEATYQVADVAEGGAVDVPVNQRDSGGEWVSLGSYTFTGADPLPRVSVRNTADAGYVRTDAVRFRQVTS